MRLNSRLRGHDSVWRDEGFFVAREPLCFNVTDDSPGALHWVL